jgi:aspartate racemase
MKTSPPIGIIGGYGPSTSAEFCACLVKHALTLRNDRAPSFLMDSIPISMDEAGRSIGGEKEATLSLIADANAGIARMAALGIPVVALPCNTLHAYFEHFAVPEGMTMLHIADSVVRELKERGMKRVGFLASGTTIRSPFYFDRLKAADIECLLPSSEHQEPFNLEISTFVRTGTVSESVITLLHELEAYFAENGAECIVLACTDIAGIIHECRFKPSLPVVDSMESLAKECAGYSVDF